MPKTEHQNTEQAQTTEENKVEKEFKIFKVKNTALYRIGFDGGGVVPEVLKGMWTSPDAADKAIQHYKELRDK